MLTTLHSTFLRPQVLVGSWGFQEASAGSAGCSASRIFALRSATARAARILVQTPVRQTFDAAPPRRRPPRSTTQNSQSISAVYFEWNRNPSQNPSSGRPSSVVLFTRISRSYVLNPNRSRRGGRHGASPGSRGRIGVPVTKAVLESHDEIRNTAFAHVTQRLSP